MLVSQLLRHLKMDTSSYCWLCISRCTISESEQSQTLQFPIFMDVELLTLFTTLSTELGLVLFLDHANTSIITLLPQNNPLSSYSVEKKSYTITIPPSTQSKNTKPHAQVPESLPHKQCTEETSSRSQIHSFGKSYRYLDFPGKNDEGWRCGVRCLWFYLHDLSIPFLWCRLG